MKIKFEKGKVYEMNSICDTGCVWSFEVMRRTKASVWLRELGKKAVKRFITTAHDLPSPRDEGRITMESVRPLGRYSMAPILWSVREVAR